MDGIDCILKKYFGYDNFLPGQRQAIESILAGHDTMAIFPTGGGKSLCYQIPALMLEGTTIVISPLISLMKDQVDELLKLGISSTYISSTLSTREVNLRIDKMRKGEYKIMYIAPERFYCDDFIKALSCIEIPFVAVDEAHCISQWGHNFRPAYLQIKNFIENIGSPIIAGFTATANKKVQQDIRKHLGMKDDNVYINSFDRPNLQFIVKTTNNKLRYVLNYIRKYPDYSGIIYAGTRKSVEQLFMFLKERNISVGMYHAGLSSITRDKTQEDFINGQTKIIVATNAFGMGINKKDVRYVIHYNMPKSVEDYYQEAGRAGRDGKKSRCILVYSKEDMRLNKYIINSNYPPLKLVKTLYKRIKARGEKGIYHELLLNSYSTSRYTIESALRKLVEYNYVKMDNGYFYIVADRPFELTQELIDIYKGVEIDKLLHMQRYCQQKKCLRLFILDYFNEDAKFDRCSNCSVCSGKMTVKESRKLNRLLDSIFFL